MHFYKSTCKYMIKTCLNEVEELARCRHGESLEVGGDVGEDGQQALEQGLEPLVAGGDDLVEHDDDEVGVGAAEHGDVHRHGRRVGLVQADTLVMEVSIY